MQEVIGWIFSLNVFNIELFANCHVARLQRDRATTIRLLAQGKNSCSLVDVADECFSIR
jgi:hypothetical protein